MVQYESIGSGRYSLSLVSMLVMKRVCWVMPLSGAVLLLTVR